MIDRHARAETPASEQSESAILDVMVAVTPLFPWHVPSDAEEPRVLLHDVPWSTYVMLRDSVEVVTLRGDRYELIPGSELIPEVDLARVAHYAMQPDQHEALKAFRDELRAGTP